MFPTRCLLPAPRPHPKTCVSCCSEQPLQPPGQSCTPPQPPHGLPSPPRRVALDFSGKGAFRLCIVLKSKLCWTGSIAGAELQVDNPVRGFLYRIMTMQLVDHFLVLVVLLSCIEVGDG